MRLSQIVTVRRLTAVGTLAAALWCGQASAQVLDQVPSDAMAVIKIKDLQATSTKVAKMAKTFGLDEFSPEMKDPLGAVLEKAKMTKGINKEGDAAVVIYFPDEKKAKEPGEDEPAAVALIPVSDYDAFVGNFEKADKPANSDRLDAIPAGVTAVKDPDGGKALYLAHRGAYAVLSDKTNHLSAKGGLKLSAIASREVDTKDAVFFFNMPVIREKAIGAIKEHRQELFDEMHKGLAEEANFKPYIPVVDTFVNKALDTATDFLNDADAVVFSLNLTDAGIVSSALVDFNPDSKLGKTVAQLKPGSTPLLAGLPAGKYFAVAGVSMDHKAVTSVADEWIDPIIKGLNDSNTDAGKKISAMLESAKTAMSSTDHSAVGVAVPTKPPGKESLFQQISVIYGDSKALAKAEKGMFTGMNDLMTLVPQSKGGVTTKFVFGETKTVDGVDLQTFSTKLDFDKNDPAGMQAQQVLGMLYGPNGASGSYGTVDDKTFIISQGAEDELIKELIASAKSGKDVLSDSAAIKSTAAQLPADRSVVYYIYLDNIVTTALKYAESFGFAVKVKLPENLPPIGIAAGAEGSSFRVDSVIPTETVQAMIAAGLKAYSDQQQGNKGGL